MKFSSILSITLLLHACFFLPTINAKRSFGVSRRTKTQKSYSARRGDGRNSQSSDSHHDPIPKPAPPPKSISKTDTHQSHASPSAPAQPGWNTHNQHPAGPPPAYPGLGHNAAPAHGMPPAYNHPPAYSPYPQQPYSAPGGGMSPYGGYQQPMGGVGYQQPMGGMGYQQPMSGMGYQQPQRSSGGGLSVGSVLTGMAVGGVATHLVGSMIPRRHITEQHIHHYEHSDKDDAPAAVPQQPQEGLAPLVTPEPVLLANPEQPQNQFNADPVNAQPPPMEPIYAFNYAPAYVQPLNPQPMSPQPTADSPETSSANPTTEDTSEPSS